jgi:uncharacterized surface protein with fasciclin (FAS1) repeats
MKIISLYLALFLGTILVTTDAAPRGSNKASGKPSLRHLKGGKGSGEIVSIDESGGGEIVTIEESGSGEISPIDDSEGGVSDCEDCDDDNDAEGHAEFAELTCKILETFDNLGRDENNIRQRDGLVWSTLCDDFNPLDTLLCPFPENVEAICSEKKPYENPAAKEWWCTPLYGVIEDVDRRNDCIKYCTNYVSEARGGCCNIDCGEEIPSPTIAPTHSMTIADFLEVDVDLSILVAGLERLNDVAVDLTLIFDGDIPCIECGRKLALRRINLLQFLDEPGDFTFFAPTNAAFKALPRKLLVLLFTSDDFLPHLEDLLMYHGMHGVKFSTDFMAREMITSFNSEKFLVHNNPFQLNNGIPVVRANFPASNGVTHVVGGVLAPAWVDRSLLDFTKTMSDLSLFLEFLILAELETLLDLFGDAYTFVAPTNDGFRAVGDATLTKWRDPANQEDLVRILEYHVVFGVYPSALLTDGASLTSTQLDRKTWDFGEMSVSVNGDTVKFNQATTKSDGRLANNGILYTIDAVLNPDSVEGFK